MDESDGIAALTTAQENVSVGLVFENQNEIQIEFTVLNTGRAGQTARNLYIDGRGGDTSDLFNGGTITETGTIPEPSSYASLLGLSALGFTCRRKR